MHNIRILNDCEMKIENSVMKVFSLANDDYCGTFESSFDIRNNNRHSKKNTR